MADAIRSWPEDVIAYKGASLWVSLSRWEMQLTMSCFDRYVDVLLPRLDELHSRQVEEGSVTLDEDGKVEGRETRTYPFLNSR